MSLEKFKRITSKFIEGVKAPEKHDNYFVYKDCLLCRQIPLYNFTENQIVESLLAIKIKNTYIGNSSIMPALHAKVSFGHYQANRTETYEQLHLSKHMLMLPFSAFKEANLDLTQIKVIERSKPEIIIKRKLVKHDKNYQPVYKEYKDRFTGACLFKVQNKYFLFDIDRQELKHKIFNPFLTTLPMPVKTIKEAYEVLKPQQVKDAERKGLKVKRQGEFFFIPINIKPNSEDKIFDRNSKTRDGFIMSSSDSSRGHRASTGFQRGNIGYVKGVITHSGREHKDLRLNGWHKVIANTSVENLTIRGDID